MTNSAPQAEGVRTGAQVPHQVLLRPQSVRRGERSLCRIVAEQVILYSEGGENVSEPYHLAFSEGTGFRNNQADDVE